MVAGYRDQKNFDYEEGPFHKPAPVSDLKFFLLTFDKSRQKIILKQALALLEDAVKNGTIRNSD